MSINLAAQLISASAGTGKTHQLSNRYLHLLMAGENPERILATTFTRKAAAEIRNRIFTRLAGAALDQEAAAKLSRELEGENFTPDIVMAKLDRLIASQNRLNICTLDSFFYQIAAVFSLELGLNVGWQIAEAVQNDEIARKILRVLFAELSAENLAQSIVRMNRGNNKYGIERYLFKNLTGLHELFLQSDKDAWFSLKRLAPRSELELSELEKQLAAFQCPRNKNGKPNAYWQSSLLQLAQLFAAKDCLEFLGKGLLKAKLEGEGIFAKIPIPADFDELLDKLLRHIKALERNKIIEQTEATYNLLSSYHAHYEKNRTASGTLSFNDIKYQVLNAQIMGNLAAVYYRLDSKIAHLLLDEFQDTAGLEWHVIYPIVDEVLSKSDGQEHSFFCVGDTKQAIYAWRGGNARIFDSIADYWPQVKKEPLTINWRSTQTVIDAVNCLFENLANVEALRPFSGVVDYWSNNFVHHEAKKKELVGYVNFSCLTAVDSEEEEDVTPIENAVRELVRELSTQKEGLSIGILTRRNETVSRLGKLLKAPPYYFKVSEEGKISITDSLAVRLCLAAITIAQHPRDLIAAYLLASSKLGAALGLSGYNVDSELSFVSSKIRERIITNGYGPTIAWLKEIIAEDLSELELKRLGQLQYLGANYDSSAAAALTGFVDYVSAYRFDDQAVSNIRVMTIHQAKGLEFDAVILPELDLEGAKISDRLVLTSKNENDPQAAIKQVIFYPRAVIRDLDDDFAQIYDQEKQETVNEMLSVLYVAMTRARYGLYMFTEREQSKNLSFSSVLRDTLTSAETQSVLLYEAGDKNWQLQKEPEITESVSLTSVTAPALELNRLKSKRKYLPHIAPSMLEGAEDIVLGKLLRFADAPQRLAARDYGSLIHKLFESIDWLDNTIMARDKLEAQCRNSGASAELVRQAVDDFEEMLTRKSINDLLRFSRYSTDKADLRLFREHPFAYRHEGQIISGYIDRLVVSWKQGKARSAEIVDYKTDTLNSNELGKKVEFYKTQLLSYRLAAARYLDLPQEQISMVLAFARNGEVVKVDA
ncbi:MAG: UvrD-helicase domain-containing protein [Deltaproteobacteria bacterium]|nr:UvrD-helicase domain-containing protein [Deltaproteobacteria bacterium]